MGVFGDGGDGEGSVWMEATVVAAVLEKIIEAARQKSTLMGKIQQQDDAYYTLLRSKRVNA